jgi:hypothetical protein
MNTQLRIGHLSPDAPAVNVLIDGETHLEGVEYGTVGEFTPVDAGSYDVEIVPAEGGDAVLSATLELAEDTSYTVLATGMLADIEALVLTDESDSVASGDARVRFVHTAPDAPAVDVYAGGAALFENVGYGDSSPFRTVEAGSYDLEVRPAGGEDAVLSVPGISLDGATAYTVFATGTLAEGLDAMLVTDLGSADADRTAPAH